MERCYSRAGINTKDRSFGSNRASREAFHLPIGWLRAAVLGANDGIVSTGSLIVGVAAANVARSEVLISGVAALVAGAMSMAAGEYVSVSSQADTERADLAKESAELARQPELEQDELTKIYTNRGLDVQTARKAAEQMMGHDALAAHARDELGISEATTARPLQAALASALTFTAGDSTVGGRRSRTSSAVDPRGGRRLASMLGGSRRSWCTGRRSSRRQVIAASDVLGCLGNGPDGRRRPRIRNFRIGLRYGNK